MARLLKEIRRVWNKAPAEALFRRGRVGRLTTTGRRTGRPRVTHVGFITRADGTVLVGAGAATRQWAENLLVDPRCTFEARDVPPATFSAARVPDERRCAVLDEFRSRAGRIASRYRGPLFELRKTE